MPRKRSVSNSEDEDLTYGKRSGKQRKTSKTRKSSSAKKGQSASSLEEMDTTPDVPVTSRIGSIRKKDIPTSSKAAMLASSDSDETEKMETDVGISSKSRKKTVPRKRKQSSVSKSPSPRKTTSRSRSPRKAQSEDEEMPSEEEVDEDSKDTDWVPKKRVPSKIYRMLGKLALSESESENDDIDPEKFMKKRNEMKTEICSLRQLRSCPFCYAIHFDIYDEEEEEKKYQKDHRYKKRVCCDSTNQYEPHACCSRGQVFVPPWRKLSTEIYSLLFGKNLKSKIFKEKIVPYNTCFSVASIQRHKIPAAPFGLPVEKTQGITRYFPSAAIPKNPKMPRYGNYYLYQGNEAASLRLDGYKYLDKEIIQRIQKDLDQYYPFGKMYMKMGELLEKIPPEENDLLRLRIIDSRLVSQKFLQENHRGIYRSETIVCDDYVAIFFKETHEKVVYPPGLNIYPRRNNAIPRPIFYWDSRINAFCYPLLFPHGELGHRARDLPLVQDAMMTYPERLAHFAKTTPEIAMDWEIEDISASKLLKEHNKKIQKKKEEGDPNLDAEKEDEENEFFDFYRHEAESAIENGSSSKVKIVERGGQLYTSNSPKDEQMEHKRVRIDPDDDEEHDFDQNSIDGDLLDALDEEEYPIEPNQIPHNGEIEGEEEGNIMEGVKPDKNAEQQLPNQEEEKQEHQERVYTSLKQWGLYIHQQRGIITDKNQKKIWIKNRFGAAGKVGQIFLIDLCTRLYQQRHEIEKKHHTEFMKSDRKKFLKALNDRANRHGRTIGCVSSVPHTIPGSPRFLQKLFEKTIAMSRTRNGKPDLFITTTANVQWPEIQDNLEPGETWADRPFLVNEVFKKKFEKLLKIIVGRKNDKYATYENGIFGKVRWYSYSIEFQQRGPPHAHLVVSLKNHIKTAAQIDRVCQAYLPKITKNSSEKEKEIRELVEGLLIHRPCEDDKEMYCRKNAPAHWKKCRKHFPKEFTTTTRFGDKNYPEYKRPNDGETAIISGGIEADNRYVVPYNPELLYFFKAHMNVEIVSNLRVVKYIFKYLFKGYDRVLIEAITKSDCPETSQMTIEGHLIYPKSLKIPEGAKIQRNEQAKKLLFDNNDKKLFDDDGKRLLVYDEYTMIEDQRALTSCEAAWEFAGYPRHEESHVVEQLYVHGEEQEPLRYKKEEQEEMEKKVLENPEDIKTRFKEWFALNQRDPEARKYTYPEIVKYYKFQKGQWVKKERERHDLFGVVKAVHPRNTEVFAIRLLSTVQKGPKSFEDLRTVNGDPKPTFVAAAKALGLMNDNQEWHRALEEASAYRVPLTLRRMYAAILVFNAVENPRELYLKFEKELVENRTEWNNEQKRAHALRHIDSFLRAHLKSLDDFNLEDLYIPTNVPHGDGWKIDDSGAGQVSQKEAEKQSNSLLPTLTEEQKTVFDTIMEDVLNLERKKDKCFFIQGSGGTGKTRLMKALYYDLVSKGKNVICVAHTGVAAKLLIYGSTAHRAFHIPLTVEDDMKCTVEVNTDEAAFLEQVNVVLWDEATMTDYRILQAVSDLFNELHNESEARLFGGVRFIFGGDWKQCLPIVAEAQGADVVNYTIKGSDLWNETEVLHLKTNMRAKNDPKFAKWINKLGRGTINIERKKEKSKKKRKQREESMPKTEERDQHVYLKYGTIVDTESELIKAVFGNMRGDFTKKLDQFKSAAILAVDNRTTFDINNKILKMSSITPTCFKSVDEHDPGRGFAHLDPEVYHGETPSGLPQHELNVVPGAPVMLLRNINTKLGLVNGTRMIVDEIGKDVIWMKILDGNEHTPERWPLTRMKFANGNVLSSEQAFIRTQFPIRLAFAITCNKSQGQTLERVGLLLRTPCFSHGQLYVAVSRVCNSNSLFIYNFNGSHEEDEAKRKKLQRITTNVVFQNALNEIEEEEEDDSEEENDGDDEDTDQDE